MQKFIVIVKKAFSNPIQRTILLTSCSLLILYSSLGFAETHPIWNPTEYVDLVNPNSRTSSTSTLQSRLSSHISMSESQLRALINDNGKNDSKNINTTNDVHMLAVLYHLTGNSDYARRAAIILDEYANHFPNWPKNYSHEKNQGSIWSFWHFYDIGIAVRLPLAYEFIRNSGEIERIGSSASKIESLLTLIIQEHFKYRLYTHNQAELMPVGIVIFGRVLDDPDLVHVGYWYLQKMLQEGYAHDGFWHEATHGYHNDVSQFLKSEYRALFSFYLDGYSDPSNFSHTPFDVRYDPPRYDNYNYESLFGDQIDRAYDVWRNATMPNGRLPITNETPRFSYAHGVPPTDSLLHGAVGHAVLANGNGATQTQARLDFSHTISHYHKDALNLIYYDKQEEVVGGTGYREGNQSWNTSTKNANLVVVNGAEQKGRFWSDYTYSPYIPGGNRSSVNRLKLSSSTNQHNNVNLFESGYKNFDNVQVVEADGLNSYDTQATRYLRTLALVKINDSDVYLADFFRVKGGTQYDWSIHGSPKTYSTSTSLSMGSTSGSFGSISFNSRAATANSWSGTFTYSGSGAKEIFTLCGESGTTVYKGSGPRSGSGYQDYIVARRTANANDDVNFMATHEVYKSSPHIQSVEKLEFDGADGTAIGMKVTLDNGVIDYIIHTLDEGPSYLEHRVTGINNFVVKGRFAHIRVTNGTVTWMNLLQGSALSYGSKTISSKDGDYSYRGMVTKVNRKAEGASDNSFEVDTVLPSNGVLDGKTLILTWGNGWKWGYKIKSTSGQRIVIDGEPAFNYSGNDIDMQYFPVAEHVGLKSFPGPVSFLIPGTAIMDGNGTVIDTDDISNPSLPLLAPENLRSTPVD